MKTVREHRTARASEPLTPGWVLLPAVAAPVLLIGGWTVAAALRPGHFDQVTRTISSLAASGAPNRWLMTTVFAVVGVCYLLTAWGLREAALPGRILLAVGGITTCMVAAIPLPADGPSVAHSSVASFAFLALAFWPLLARRSDPALPWALRPLVSVTASMVLFGLLVWFGVELNVGARIGLSERIAAGAQAVWPGAVAYACVAARVTFGRCQV